MKSSKILISLGLLGLFGCSPAATSFQAIQSSGAGSSAGSGSSGSTGTNGSSDGTDGSNGSGSNGSAGGSGGSSVGGGSAPASVSGASTPAPRPSGASNVDVCASVSIPGVDVSDYDPGTQWPAVAHAGAGFVYIKATEGTTFTNPLFASDWPAARSAGIIRGAYHFFHPSDDPVQQATYFLQNMGALASNDLPPMLDWEVTDGVANDVDIQNALTWLSAVQEATGKIPVVYVDPSFFNALGNPQQFAGYPLFIANYDVKCPSIPPPWSDWTFWQIGNGPFPGLTSSQADLDVFNGTLEQLSRFATDGSY